MLSAAKLSCPSTTQLVGVPTIQNLFSTLVSWGRNAEGQCGVESSPLVIRPTPVIELHGSHVKSVHVGKLASCAITEEGETWTWGCGKAGKLGQGNADPVKSPSRVESFVDSTSVVSAALSDQHTLFVDSRGHVWSCGENKEGQCGLGTPHDVLAQQHYKAWHQSIRPSEDTLLREAARGQKDKYTRYLQLLSEQEHYSSQVGVFKAGFAPSTGPRKAPQHRIGLSTGGGSGGSESSVPMSLGFGGFDVEGYMTSSGLMPGQLHTPTRVGHPNHPLLDPALEPWMASDDCAVLEGVVDVAAARHFSLAATFSGEVWSWGACFNGGLGSESSWSSSPQQVGEELGAMLCAAGGAVKVAAGGTFALALTASGKVVVWGKLGGGLLATAVRTTGTEVAGLPAITAIAAGQQHALLTDGETVWALGRWVDSAGREAGLASWEAPQKVLSLPGQQITQVVAGPHTSAAVTASGRLYMWGRLLDVHHAEGLGRRLHRDVLPEDVNWGWAGFGSDVPMVVEGLEGVRAVGLGGWHAVALLD